MKCKESFVHRRNSKKGIKIYILHLKKLFLIAPRVGRQYHALQNVLFLRLFLPLALQHMCEFISCESLSRRLATSCAKKAAVICSVLSETTLRTLNQPAVFSKQTDRTGKKYFFNHYRCAIVKIKHDNRAKYFCL